MATCVYCLARSEAQAIRIAQRLRNSGFPSDDISLLYPDPSSPRDLAHENSTKAPEGATIGAGTGAIVGGALGWLTGIGVIAISGMAPLVAAGPILAALSGAAAGGTLGGLSGALVGAGIPEYEAKQFAGKLNEGNILISVHAADADEADQIRMIFEEEKAEDISIGTEVAVPSARRSDIT